MTVPAGGREKPRPALIDAGDAIVRITTSTICGTDLHILKGDVPSVTPGRVLGHEGVGVIEAVGVPATFDICQEILAPGGRLANIGVHGKPVELRIEKLWDRNVTITTRLVDTETTPMLLKVVQAGKVQPARLATHRFALADVMQAYDTFANAAREGALKVILTA